MFKFLLLALLVAVAQADVDKFLGKAITIAISPYVKEFGVDCNWYTISKVSGTECTCGGRTNIPLVSLKFESVNLPEEFFAADEVKSNTEVDEAVKIEKCKCGDKEYPFTAFKEINDNYHIIYSAPVTPNGLSVAILSVKTLPTQADLDETVGKVQDLNGRTDYKVFCGLQ